MNKPVILIIDDEPQMRKLLEISLEHHDYLAVKAETAKEALVKVANHPPDAILLDLDLPDKNGHWLLNELREWYSKPIIIISATNTEKDIVMALDNGATDYLTKPFRTGELLARLRSALRRNNTSDESSVISIGELTIDLIARTVLKNNQPVKLTSTEYALLILFAKNEGKALTHQFILKEVWGVGYQSETQYLRVFVAQLRKKIEKDPNRPEHILTESGIGYRMK